MSDDHTPTGNYIDGSGSPAQLLGAACRDLVPAASAQVRDRLASGMRQVDGLPVLIVSGIAALVMTGGGLVLRRHYEDETDEHDLSVTAVLLDTIADAATAGVAAKGAIILATDGWYWLDPAVALTIAFHAIALIRKVLIRLGPAGCGRQW